MTRAEAQAGIAAVIAGRDRATWASDPKDAAAHIMREFVDPYKATEEKT